ncbi:MAG: FAD binding domain-containing protein [Alphaproteobacteria bacterium]|jgi:2-furoyl-CoA dehydrogenase FAD binding subunit|nr:FAD binding domain-containing protein [Alphaproteobacteria bacterium]
MKPTAFDYLRADNIEEALAALAEYGERARILAGGQSLIAMVNFRLLEPELLVDIANVKSLRYIRPVDGSLEIGATITQAELMAWPELEKQVPLVARALPHLGHMQTRNRGTVCGSIAHADPSSELPLCLATLGGDVVLRSARGERVLGADAFQTGMLATARADDEMVTAVRLPLRQPGDGHAFDEMALRRGDFAVTSVAAVANGEAVRLGVGGVADRPTLRNWDGLADDAIDDALNAFAWELGGQDDIHASARYRRELVRRLGRRVIEEARSCRA